MSLLAAAFLGIVQAATEFLPVSSTAHLLVCGELLGHHLDDPQFRAFVVVIQTGTTLAVIAYFREDLARILGAVFRGLAKGAPLGTFDARLGWMIALGTLPAALIGKLLEGPIESLGNTVIAGSLIVWGLVLWAAERFARHERGVDDVRTVDAVAVGLGQALALVPGTSRSGATLTTAMLLGFRREAAARFSFLLSVPIILAAGGYKLAKVLPDLRGAPEWRDATIAGTVVSFFFGYAVIAWLLRWLRTRSTHLFIVWRIAAGVVVAALLYAGVLPR